MKLLSKEQVVGLVRLKAISPKDAREALRPEHEEPDKLDEITKILKAISIQNAKLIEITKAVLATPEGGEDVIEALQLQTESIINELKKLEEKPVEKKKWNLTTGEIERGRDGKVTSMEVIAVQV